jgi:hypothetical protein
MSLPVDQMLRKARRQASKGDTDGAIAVYKNILAVYPKNK